MLRNWIAAHRSAVATATSGTVIAAVIATTALLATGYEAQRMDLGDGAVWVVNGEDQALGRASTAVLELNSVIRADGSDLEVVQEADDVLLVDRANASLDIIDPATSEKGDTVALPPEQPAVWLAGSNVVIQAQGTGEIWIVPLADLQGFDPIAEPTLSYGIGSVLTVDPDGMLYAYSPDNGEVYRVDAASSTVPDAKWSVEVAEDSEEFQIAAVGGRWALLDVTERRLHLDGRTVDLSSEVAAAGTPRLQSSSVSGDRILLADSEGLLAVPADGEPERLTDGRSGAPAPPIVAGDCVFAAWAGDGAWRECGDAEGEDLELEALGAGATLAFARNGTRVVLNDTRSGATWAVQRDGQLIDNWDDLITEEDDQEQVEDDQEDTPPELEEQQQPPVAVDDELGARPGRSSVLPVLLNDYDPNGDVLVIATVTPLAESTGRVDLINNNQQLQLTLPAEAAGVITFGYSISDGRGGTASATVRVTVREAGENSAPQQVRTSKTTVESGGQVTTQVLGDWVDPDGDAFYLEAASVAEPDRVSSKPDGLVLFTDSDDGGELKTVGLAVSDGSATGSGSLAVTVRPRGDVPIIADPFVVLANAGEERTVKPLEHVRGGNGVVRLNAVPPKTGVSIVPSFDAGTFTFTSDQVRTHYLEYVVTDGDQTVTGLVRIDVTAPPDASTRPITIPKTIFVRTGSTATIDVASSDIDPAGGVLLVTGVDNVPPASGVLAEILEQRSVRVTLTRPLDAPTSFNYRISNGLAEAEGTITVVEIPLPAELQPPIAVDDAVTVRVGDAIDIPVLANDEQPDGADITLDAELPQNVPSGGGLLFTSTDRLRYLAPDEPGNYTAVYSIRSGDQSAQARVTISVREKDRATNNAPVPTPVTARVLAGETVRITIPLTGIDPDGDSVQLLGQASNPDKGAVRELGPDYITYEAGAYSAGTDSFTYTMVDSLGARATGTIRVGISPRLEGGRNPVAVADVVTVRPGKSVTVQVLSNDSDPDGGVLTVTTAKPVLETVTAEIVDDRFVTITPPAGEGQYAVIYTIANDTGGSSSNYITVTVDADAPLARPVARDTSLAVKDVLGRDTIDVPVLQNVFFADGPVSQLGVTLLPNYDSTAEVLDSKRIRVTVREQSQIIPFAVYHPDDAAVKAYAFIRVPGLDDALPQLDPAAREIKVKSEQAVTIDLNDYVVAISGRQVRLTDTTTVRATHSDGANLVVDQDTLVFTSADQYFGPASISFEVTDGDPQDPAALSATLVLPITVEPRDNQPPVFRGASLSFEPGGQQELDLVKLTDYPYDDDLAELQYTVLEPQPTGFTVALNGQRLLITADAGAVKNTSTSVSLGVKDAINDGRAGRILLKVVPSTRPLARLTPDTAIAKRGETTAVDVLANDQVNNPFPGTPLTVVAIRGLDGATLPDGLRVTPSADSSRLTVTTAGTTAPVDVNLQYQVADATKDPDRYVWGNVRIAVQDRPDPVSAVRVTEFGDRTLRLSWAPGQFNNSPITGYEVSVLSAGDGRVLSTITCSGAASCVVTTPGNGPDNAVRISVVAVNAIGRSDAAVTPSATWSDIIPPAPTGLGSTPLDGALRVTWQKPSASSAASPITYYVVTVGGISETVTVPASDPAGTSYSAAVGAGLANGSVVSFSVSARNSAPNSLATWNQASSTGTPAGGPINVLPATASSPNGTTIDVGWAGAFANNGRAILSYWAVAYTGSSPTCTVTGVADGTPSVTPPRGSNVQQLTGEGSTFTSFTGLNVNQQYRVVVFAYNGQDCTRTANPITVIPRSAPGTVTTLTVAGPAQADGGFTWDYAISSFGIQSGPSAADSFVYQLEGVGVDGTQRGPVAIGASTKLTSNGTQYGNRVSVRIKACQSYPELSTPLCSANWSEYVLVGVPVNNADMSAGLQRTVNTTDPFDPVYTYSWISAPGGADYESVTFSCDDGATWTPTSAASSCQATTSLLGVPRALVMRITANGGVTYDRSYAW